MCALHDLADQDDVRVRFVMRARRGVRGHRAPLERRARRARGCVGDFAITGEPTDLHVGVQAKGVLAVPARRARPRRARLDAVARRQRGPEGDRRLPANRVAAVLARVLRAVRPAVDQPRADRRAATRSTRCPTSCTMDVDIRYLPNQDPGDILEQIRAIPDMEVARTFIRPPAHVSRTNPYVLALVRRVGRLDERRGDERRPRRRLRRGLVPAGRHPRGRVRPGRRRPPRARGVGLDLLAAPATARR